MSHKKRIALVARKYTPFGGKELFLEDLMKGFLNKGCEVHIVAQKWDSKVRKELQVPLHSIPVMPGDVWMKAWSFARNAIRYIDNARFDLAVAVDRVPGVNLYITCDNCLRESYQRRATHGSIFKRSWLKINPRYTVMKSIEENLFRSPRLDKVIAISHKVKDEILLHYPQLAKKIQVIYHGIPPQIESPLTKQQAREILSREFPLFDDKVIFLSVGSGFETKGVAYTLQAVARFLPNVPLRVIFVGKGDIAKYQNRAKNLGIQDYIHFAGPRSDVGNFYRAADAFVLPSQRETFGMVYLEAMIHELPAIFSGEAGASEIVEHQKSGVVVQNPTDSSEIYQAMQYLLDVDIRRKIADEAIKIARQYSLERNIEEIYQVVESLTPQNH